MIETPSNVCLDNGFLRWQPVPYADGYNIHKKSAYLASVEGVDNTHFAVHWDETPEDYTVSAWVRPLGAATAHTQRSLPAKGRYEPKSIVHRDLMTSGDNWLPRFPYWDHTINNELQIYTPQALTFDEDGLTIRAERDAAGNWTSGLISGPLDRAYLYGYFEAEIEFPFESGLLPAFWLLNKKYVGLRPEIDIAEVIAGQVKFNYHWWAPEHNDTKRFGSLALQPRFNKYGLLWERNRLTWFVNRMPVFTTWGDHVSRQYMYPILNLAVGGDYPGAPPNELNRALMRVREFAVYEI